MKGIAVTLAAGCISTGLTGCLSTSEDGACVDFTVEDRNFLVRYTDHQFANAADFGDLECKHPSDASAAAIKISDNTDNKLIDTSGKFVVDCKNDADEVLFKKGIQVRIYDNSGNAVFPTETITEFKADYLDAANSVTAYPPIDEDTRECVKAVYDDIDPAPTDFPTGCDPETFEADACWEAFIHVLDNEYNLFYAQDVHSHGGFKDASTNTPCDDTSTDAKQALCDICGEIYIKSGTTEANLDTAIEEAKASDNCKSSSAQTPADGNN